jgi:hypothetical protein
MNLQAELPAYTDDGAVALLPESPSDRIGERRSGSRRYQRLRACLTPLSRADAIRCDTDNLGAGGIHVTVPVGYGIAVGQRFELQIAAPGASLGMGPLLTSPGYYATVVRTRLQLGAEGDHVGVGLRFDRPLANATC